jgi:hypothetical protein
MYVASWVQIKNIVALCDCLMSVSFGLNILMAEVHSAGRAKTRILEQSTHEQTQSPESPDSVPPDGVPQ